MNIEKPPVLTYGEIYSLYPGLSDYSDYKSREIQRDADAAHYEPKIEVLEALLAGKDAAIRDLRLQLKQVKAEVAREILGKALYGYKTKALYKDKFIPARQVIFKEDDWEAITSKYPKYVEGK